MKKNPYRLILALFLLSILLVGCDNSSILSVYYESDDILGVFVVVDIAGGDSESFYLEPGDSKDVPVTPQLEGASSYTVSAFAVSDGENILEEARENLITTLTESGADPAEIQRQLQNMNESMASNATVSCGGTFAEPSSSASVVISDAEDFGQLTMDC
jgi:hypothetical protein